MARKEPDEKTKKAVYALCGVIAAIAIIACFAIIGSTLSSVDSSSAQPTSAGGAEQPAQEQVTEQPAQVFDNEFAMVEYRDTQDVGGNALITFMLTNKTGSPVRVTGDNVVINGQYNVQTLGGSQTQIDPGNTGSVPLTFGVNVQTPLAGVSDMQTFSADLVLRDDSTFDVVGSIHVDVVI